MKRKPYLHYHSSKDYWFVEWHEMEINPDTGKKKLKRITKSLGIKGARNRKKAHNAMLEVIGAPEADSTTSDLTFLEFQSEYLRAVKNSVRPKTFKSYKYSIDKFSGRFGHLPLDSITPKIIERFKAEIAELLNPTSVNIILRSVRAGFGFAVRQGYLQRSPFGAVKLVDVPGHSFDPFWTPEQFTDFLDDVNDARHRVAFGLAFYAGLRLGEAVHLRWKDVDFKKKLIRIESSPDFRTKSGHGRKVPLYGPLRDELDCLEKTGEYVLSSKNKISDPSAISRAFRRYAEEFRGSNLDVPKISFHGLRHSFATNLAPHLSITVLQKLLGHADISVTMKYTHVQDDVAVNAAAEVKF